MSVVGEATGVLGLLGKGWSWLEDQIDPARLSAKRLILAFEAYGVARQQIIRLLPAIVLQAKPEVLMADFSLPRKLKLKLSTTLLDWAADYLHLRRAWLDGVDEHPHIIVDRYKQPADYHNWLGARQEQSPYVSRWVTVWKTKGEPVGPNGTGPLCLVYEETYHGLDGLEGSHYWLLSDHWSLSHAPCVENMTAAIAVAHSLGIMVIGSDLPRDKLMHLVEGKILIPEAKQHRCGLWHPLDLINPLPGQDSPWRRDIWNGAQTWLVSTNHVNQGQ
jgi:hypothetical protein